MMKLITFITLFICLFFNACKAKSNDETSAEKTIKNVSRQTLKQKNIKKTNRQTLKQKSNVIKINHAASASDNIDTVIVNQENEKNDLKVWKKQVSKNLEPIPFKPKTTHATIASSVKNISSAKNFKTKKMIMVDESAKTKKISPNSALSGRFSRIRKKTKGAKKSQFIKTNPTQSQP